MKFKYVDCFLECEGIPEGSEDFFCTIAIYYDTSHKIPDTDAYFSVTVASPLGVYNFFKKEKDHLKINKYRYWNPIIIFDTYDEKKIIDSVKEKFKSLSGKNENILKLYAMRFFDWEYQDDEVAINELIYG